MNTPHSTVLILGARGRFGLAAAAAFAQAGWRVIAQRRPGRAAGTAPGGVRWIEADVQDTDALVSAAGPVNVVVHAMNPAYTAAAWRAEAPGLMQAAIEAARALGAVLLFPGNVYNFGAGMPELLAEDTPQRPTNDKGRIRVALERQLTDAFERHGLRSVVIRAGDFFGSGTGSLFDRVIAKDLPRGRMGWAGAPGVATPWAYLPDLAATFVRVAERGAALQGAAVLHFAGHSLDDEAWREPLTAIARRLGFVPEGGTVKVTALPWALIRAGGLVMPTWASLAEVRYLWTTPHALDNRRLVRLIGPEPRTPLPLALARSLVDLGMVRSTPRPQLA